MVKFKKTKGSVGGDSISDSVSELSHDETSVTSGVSKTSAAFRSKFFRGKNSASASKETAARASKKTAPPSSPGAMATDDRSVGSVGTSPSMASSSVSKKIKADSDRMVKDAKSRFNIGLIYLKTGDYAKAQDNLEHSLYCHIQLHGHNGREYTNDVLFAIAGVREKLGDCYLANPAVADKGIAMGHYEESRRLLGNVAAEDAPDNIKAMLERVDERLQEVSKLIPRGKSVRPTSNQANRTVQKYQQQGNDKSRALLGMGAAGGAAVAAMAVGANTMTSETKSNSSKFDTRRRMIKTNLAGLAAIPIEGVQGIQQGIQHGIQQGLQGILICANLDPERVAFLNDIASTLIRKVDVKDRKYRMKTYPTCFVGSEMVDYMVENQLAPSRSEAVKIGRELLSTGHLEHVVREHDFKDDFLFYHFKDPIITKECEVAMTHLERNNHHTALNHLTSLQEGGMLKSENFRAEWVSCMMLVADSALQGEKVSLATGAYEAVYAVLKEYEDTGPDLKLAMRGCIKGHKLMAIEFESLRDYASAIEQRTRVYKILSGNDRIIPACRQLLKVAYLHGEDENFSKGATTLADAIRRLSSGVKSLDADALPFERVNLLCQCQQLRAIFLSKTRKWIDASEQYGELLPMLAKAKGSDSREYNSALIQNAALSVTLKNYHKAHDEVTKYLELAKYESSDGGRLIVDDMDHVLALDTCAATYLKIGHMDKAIHIFEKKLAFVKTLRDNDEMRSDTMHKLGCLLAYKNQPTAALPLLNEALDVRRGLYDGKNKSVLESTWAVAATTQSLGDKNKALAEYSILLDKMDKSDDNFPVSAVLIHNSAGKLFSDEGQADKAIHCFRQALLAADTPEMKTEISLNLANALSAKGDESKAMELYGRLLKTKSLNQSKLFFLALFNKSHLLIKMGEVAEAKEILHKIAETTSAFADDVKVSMYLTLGNLAVSEGRQNDALKYFENSLDVVEDDDVISFVQVKKHIGLMHFVMGQYDKAIASFEDALEALSEREGKPITLLKADVWNLMTRVYKQKGDLSRAKNFAKLGKHLFEYLSMDLFILLIYSSRLSLSQRCRVASQIWARHTLIL